VLGHQVVRKRGQLQERLPEFFQLAVAHRDRDIPQETSIFGALNGARPKHSAKLVFA
jgi:hypothetical protein